MLQPGGKHEQSAEGQTDVEVEEARQDGGCSERKITGEKKTIEALTSTSADIRAVLVAELQKKIEECGRCCLEHKKTSELGNTCAEPARRADTVIIIKRGTASWLRRQKIFRRIGRHRKNSRGKQFEEARVRQELEDQFEESQS